MAEEDPLSENAAPENVWRSHIPGSVPGQGKCLFLKKGRGSTVQDMDNKEYIDYFLCDGAVILGHGHPAVEDAVRLALEEGVTLGGPLRAESQLADLLQKALGNRDDVTIRFTNSGTEAVLNAVMLSRIFTGREGVILIGGNSHGHASLLCDSRSPVPLSPECESRGNAGKDYVEKIPFNEVAVLQELVETRENDFGCILMEPIQSRSGLVLPDEGYLETVREISQEYEILLIFDEVYTGFRAAHGGAFRLFDVFPDFMCFGPIIAGGLPLGALCGKKLVLDLLFPTGPLFQAGNLSSRSISYQAGLRTLEILNDAGSYSTLEDRTAALASEHKACGER